MFKKWPEITNSYQNKNISYFLENFPELLHCEYEITEKLDGSNISFLFSNEERKIFSRNERIMENKNFYDVWNIIKEQEYVNYFNSLQNEIGTYSNEYGIINTIQIYGEICGPGIQKRINYGDKKFIKFFGVRINNILISPYESREYFIPEEFYIPVIDIICGQNSLDNVLKYDENIISKLSPLNDKAEGIVIKPLKKVYESFIGETFFLKKKTKEFSEKMGKKIKVINGENFIHPMEGNRIEFLRYINENRVLSVFSKEGEISSPKEIKKYILLTVEDAKKDFLKDYPEIENLDEKDKRYIYGPAGSKINKILQNYL